jgi:hypothetical protein
MGTNSSEPKQEATDPADLLQQETHVEAVDSRSFVAPSDDERLDPGVSTNRRQTKRISEAQRKRLTRQRKMRGKLNG